MEAVKLKLYQNMVNYRRELSFGYVQSYPLPTPSMVRGMVHYLIDAKEYHPLKISIQGRYNTVVTNMQKVYKFDRDRNARPDNPYTIEIGSSNKTAKSGLMFVDQLVDVNLILHIYFEESNLNQQLYHASQLKTLILGRNEDIARLDECKITKLEKCDEEIELSNCMYIPEPLCKKKQVTSTAYRLPFKYAAVENFSDKRIFDYVNVQYVDKSEYIEMDNDFIDDERNAVIFLENNNA